MPVTSPTPCRSISSNTSPRRANQFPTHRCLEDRFGGVALAVQARAVERGAASVRSFGDVEDRPVQVDSGVAQSAGAMHEHRPQEALARLAG